MSSTSNPTDWTAPGASSMTATESALADMWRDLLERPLIEPSDNFFEIGGTSLTAIKLLQRVEKMFGEDALTPDALYADPTLSSVAQVIDETVGA